MRRGGVQEDPGAWGVHSGRDGDVGLGGGEAEERRSGFRGPVWGMFGLRYSLSIQWRSCLLLAIKRMTEI